MKACVDVYYRPPEANAACILFQHWTDGGIAAQFTQRVRHVEPYQSGQFYRRELPCILAVLSKIPEPLEVVLIDGYVWLSRNDAPGLGAHLHQALEGRVPVIGVAKRVFAGAPSIAVLRGRSRAPLFVSSVGLPARQAAHHIQIMHGVFRIPTLLRAADRLSRLVSR